jgi:PAS domain S-box-containing protein
MDNKFLLDNKWFLAVNKASRDGLAIEYNEKIIFVNDAFVKLYKYDSRDELLGKSISLVNAPETDALMLEFGRKRLRNEEVPEVYEAKAMCKDGTIIDIEITATIVEYEGEKYIVDINRDISERKNFERSLHEQNDKLQKINAELDRFVYSASHDLRAPLRSLLGLVQVFRMDDSIEQKKEYLNRMEKSIKFLDSFIREIIDYSRNSRTKINSEPIVLHELLNEVIEHLKYDSQAAVPVIEEFDRDLVVYSDYNRLMTIFSNLISNSYRYSNKNIENSFIKIQAKVITNLLTIRVEDNGIGIANVHLTKIFDMFYRANQKSTGTGLGLFIVKETIDILKGEINISSKVGEGTIFTIIIPSTH